MGRVASLMFIVDNTVQWCISSEMCWVALLDRFTLASELELYTTVNGGMGSPFGFCCRQCTVMVFAGSSNSSPVNSVVFFVFFYFLVLIFFCQCPGGSV